MFICRAPDTSPAKFPLREKPPVALAPPAKHGLELVKFRLVILRLPPLTWVSVRLKSKTGELLLFELISAAVQFPLMEPLLLLSPPHATSIKAIPRTRNVQ